MDVRGQQAVKKAASMTESCAVCETLNRSFNLVRWTVDSQFEAASTKEEQMGGPLIVHQVSFSVHIDCRVCICVGICHETSLCGRWTSSRWQGQGQ